MYCSQSWKAKARGWPNTKFLVEFAHQKRAKNTNYTSYGKGQLRWQANEVVRWLCQRKSRHVTEHIELQTVCFMANAVSGLLVNLCTLHSSIMITELCSVLQLRSVKLSVCCLCRVKQVWCLAALFCLSLWKKSENGAQIDEIMKCVNSET